MTKKVTPMGNSSTRTLTDQKFSIKSLSTGRCLSNNGKNAPVLLPCDTTKPEQVRLKC